MRVTLETGKRYKADVRLGFFEGLASNDTIAAKLLDAGFVGVTVFGKGRDRWATGEWGGAMQTVNLPSQITNVLSLPTETLNGFS